MKYSIALPLAFTLTLAGCNTAAESTRTPQGNANAAIVIEEYADLQCPACRAAHTRVMKPILEEYGDQIRYDFKHFPLRSIHRYALDAAEVAECAADQDKFWDFIDIAYERQDELSEDTLLEWAGEIGLNVDEVETCWKSHSKRSIPLADYQQGRDLGVTGTPTFFVNGEKTEAGFDTLSAAIEARLGAGFDAL